jgi:Immunity protein 53
MHGLSRLQTWFAQQCNGDWEHAYGVQIETVDNPGWVLTIDLMDTRWEKVVSPRQRIERTGSDWLQTEIANAQFVGAGGPPNLEELIERFFGLIDGAPPA